MNLANATNFAPAPAGTAPRPFVASVNEQMASLLSPRGGQEVGRAYATALRLACSPEAKRTRASLLGSVAVVVGLSERTAVELACAVELIHAASLLHDDVVDASSVRRGTASANALNGNAFAVLCGDLVLTRALEVVGEHGAALTKAAVDVVDEMTQASLLELDDRGRLEDPQTLLTRWRVMAEGKTGALCGLCAELPCLAVGDARRERLRYGLRRFGVAFQIIDDLLDLTGGDATKPQGQDLRERNQNLVVLHARRADPETTALLSALWRPRDDGGTSTAAEDTRASLALSAHALQAGGSAAIDEATEAMQDARDALGAEVPAMAGVIAQTMARLELARLPGARRTP